MTEFKTTQAASFTVLSFPVGIIPFKNIFEYYLSNNTIFSIFLASSTCSLPNYSNIFSRFLEPLTPDLNNMLQMSKSIYLITAATADSVIPDTNQITPSLYDIEFC